MDLNPVAHMDQFNWRAELGSPLVRAMRTLGVTLVEHDLRPKSRKRRPVAAADQDSHFANSAFPDSQVTEFLESREMEGQIAAPLIAANSGSTTQDAMHAVKGPKALSLFQGSIRDSFFGSSHHAGMSLRVIVVAIGMGLLTLAAVAWSLFS